MSEHPNQLSQRLKILDPQTALRELEAVAATDAALALSEMPPAQANAVLAAMDVQARAPVLAAAPEGAGWADAQSYAEGSVGRLLEPSPAVFVRSLRVADAIEQLRVLIQQRMVVYVFVVDERRHLLGVVAFRELLFAPQGSRLSDIMLRNLGAQALAVMVRAMTLGETRAVGVTKAVAKEALLGLFNGSITGALAGAAMYWAVLQSKGTNALSLAVITLVAMSISAAIAGLSGALIPLALKRWGADPATASSIFLTTITDVVSMGSLLALASWLLR